MLLNRYEWPHCECTWSDTWACQVDDDCLACGVRRVSPDESLEFDAEVDQEVATSERPPTLALTVPLPALGGTPPAARHPPYRVDDQGTR